MVESIIVIYKVFENQVETTRFNRIDDAEIDAIARDGHLFITRGNVVERIYAPGVWKTVKVVLDGDDEDSDGNENRMV